MTPSQKYQRLRRKCITTTGDIVENKKRQLHELLEIQADIIAQLRSNEKAVSALRWQLIPNTAHIGSWECITSPINICCYDKDDHAEDFCIYCGQPDERK